MPNWTAVDDFFENPEPQPIETIAWDLPGHTIHIYWGGKHFKFANILEARKAGFQI
jgi:hypothetical protein